MKLAIWIGLFGAIGAMSRFFCTKWIGNSDVFPIGTLTINMIGSLLLGLLLGWTLTSSNMPEHWRIPLATGFLGSLTTFSTFAVEAVKLMENGHYKSAIIYVSTHLIIGLLMAFIGLWIGKRWS